VVESSAAAGWEAWSVVAEMAAAAGMEAELEVSEVAEAVLPAAEMAAMVAEAARREGIHTCKPPRKGAKARRCC
jgi:hypothetical protein